MVYQMSEPAELLYGAVDDRLTARHRRDARGFGDGFAACRHDLVDHLLRDTRIGTPALRSATEIVDHDLRTLPTHQQRRLPPDSPSFARGNRAQPHQSSPTLIPLGFGFQSTLKENRIRKKN